jgi:hypothetical protein
LSKVAGEIVPKISPSHVWPKFFGMAIGGEFSQERRSLEMKINE